MEVAAISWIVVAFLRLVFGLSVLVLDWRRYKLAVENGMAYRSSIVIPLVIQTHVEVHSLDSSEGKDRKN